MDQETQDLLGFPKVIDLIRRYAQTPAGKEALSRLKPTPDRGWIEDRAALVGESARYLSGEGRISFSHLEDPRPIAHKLQEGVLDPADFLCLLDLMKVGREIQKRLSNEKWPRLAAVCRIPDSLPNLISTVERTFDPDGEIRDSAHPELSKVRRLHQSNRSKVQQLLEGFLKGAKEDCLIQEAFVTSRNGRFVVPVKAERQKDIPGVVHGSSSSGATVFLEPFKAVELNNQFIFYQDREEEIRREVLARLTQSFRAQADAFGDLIETVSRVDSLLAIASFGEAFGCVLPELSDERRLELEEARHPLLIDSLDPDRVVPISIGLSPLKNGLIISGPNTGGKTVALKSLGLLTVMAQAGLPVPALRAVVPCFRQILADIGDHQSLDSHLSTFSAHVLRIKGMMEGMLPPCLILLDEIGTGTDPVHGAALGVAIIDYFRRYETLVVGTTHHQALKVFASTQPGMENASVELDPETQEPTYRIRLGLSGTSSGLQIASRLGLDDAVVEQAKGLLDETDRQAELYLHDLREELTQLRAQRELLEQQQAELRKEQVRLGLEMETQLRKQRDRFERDLEGWAREFSRQSNHFLKSVRDRFEAARLRSQLQQRESLLKEAFRQQIRGEAVKMEGAPPLGEAHSAFHEGQRVSHRGFQREGRVISVDESGIEVDFLGKRMTCRAEQLEPLQGEDRRLPPNVTLMAVSQAAPDLNLIGKTVDDALDQADKFLDTAFLSALNEVRLIHGFGKGRLKIALSQFLKEHPHVAACEVQGGSTLVRLRQD